MNYLNIIFWVAVVGVFAYMWRQGQLLRLSNYVAETREELKKCTWPSVDELKGSTAVVMITIALLGGFTIGMDLVIAQLIRLIL